MGHIFTFIRHWWPTGIVVMVILYATWWPDPVGAEEMPKIPHLDKLIHAIMMGGLTGALMFDYRRSSPSRRPLTTRAILAFTAAAMAFGTLDETVQGLLPIGRPADPVDLLADWAGCLIAAFTAPSVINRIFRKGSREKQ